MGFDRTGAGILTPGLGEVEVDGDDYASFMACAGRDCGATEQSILTKIDRDTQSLPANDLDFV